MNEHFKHELERAKKEAEEHSKNNEKYREQIANLKKKIFEYENLTKEFNNLNEKNLKEISEIKMMFEGNKLENKTNDEIKWEDDMEEEEEEISEDENNNINEFLEKMKKLNHKRKKDNENLKAFRKENRK